MKKGLIFIIVFLAFFTINVHAAEVKTGTYKIINAKDESKLLVEKNGNIVLGDDNSTGEKYWDVFSNGSYYYIRSHSNNAKALDAKGAKAQNGVNIQLYNVNNSNAQKWKLNYASSGYYYITSIIANYNIETAGGKTNVGNNIQLYKNNGTIAQKWKFVRTNSSSQAIANGDYIIKSKLNNSNVLDLAGGKTANSTNVQVYTNNFTWAQVWNIKYEDGHYKISSYLDKNKVLDIYGGRIVRGSNIQVYQSNGSLAQKFTIIKNSDGTVSINSHDNLWSLDIVGASTKSGTNVQLYQSNGTNAQKYVLEKVNIAPLETGYYNIYSKLANNKVIGLNNKAIVNGKNVDLRTETTNNYTKWYIKKIKHDTYSILNADNTKMSLDVVGNYTTDRTNVQLYKSNDSDAQKWVIRKTDDGSYKIMGLKSKKVLDVSGGSSADGSNIQIFTFNDTNAQKWRIESTEISQYVKEYDNGKYLIKTKSNANNTLDVYGAYKANGTKVQKYQINDTAAQVWKLEYAGDGEFIIRSMLNPRLALTESSNTAVISKYTGGNNQKWFFDKSGTTTKIISKNTGKYITISSSGAILTATPNNDSLFELSSYTKTLRYRGIDVSKHNGDINWKEVAKRVDYAVIRAGYSDENIVNGVDKYQDIKYLDNVKGCEDNNLPYALYFYSYANKLNDSDNPSYNKGAGGSADSEAAHMLKLIKKSKDKGYSSNLSIPVYFDQEEANVYNTIYNYYKNDLSKTRTLLTNIVNRFCTKMKNNGYKCGVYASKSWIDNRLNTSTLNQNGVKYWVAQWPMLNATTQKYHSHSAVGTATSSFSNPKHWQFSSTGTITGISGNVDLDFGYDIFE
ncbi:MAG: RICIN domain-containing protein [Bacilli bacterium]|nr:RICIN domain-containing protein [Bacilli bacterium]